MNAGNSPSGWMRNRGTLAGRQIPARNGLKTRERHMYLSLVQQVSVAGKTGTPNDDRVGCGHTHAWVVDGATDLGEPGLVGNRGGAAWLATEVDRLFSIASGSMPMMCETIFAGISAAYESIRRRDPQGPWEIPRAAFAAVAIENGSLACAFAGDCTVLLRGACGSSFITQLPNRQAERAEAASLGEGATAGVVRSPAVLENRRASRSAPASTLSIDENASRISTRITISTADRGNDVLLMSDGFAALVETYALYEPSGLIDAVVARGLPALVEELRSIELEDRRCIRFPRFKTSDDATAIWLRID
jgi:hypothetical protein